MKTHHLKFVEDICFCKKLGIGFFQGGCWFCNAISQNQQEPVLTHAGPRFQTCCQKGFQGALKLVAFASGISQAALEAKYRKWCSSGSPDGVDDEQMAADEMLEPSDEDLFQKPGESNECHDILTCLQGETVFVDPEADESTVPNDNVEMAFAKVKDMSPLEPHLCAEEPDRAKEPGNEQKDQARLPSTLLDAFQCPGDRFNALWRLTLRLRCGPGGVDRRWIRNHHSVRKASRSLNWHQSLGIIMHHYWHTCCQ